jgi:hypothetical protein
MKVIRVGSAVPGPPLISPAAGIGRYGGVELAARMDATSKSSGAGVCARQSVAMAQLAKIVNQNLVTRVGLISAGFRFATRREASICPIAEQFGM